MYNMIPVSTSAARIKTYPALRYIAEKLLRKIITMILSSIY